MEELRRENALLRESNASLQAELSLARDSNAVCMQQLKALLTLTERYASQLRVQSDADRHALSRLQAQDAKTYPAAPTTPGGRQDLNGSFVSQNGGGMTPVVSQQLVHDSPPNARVSAMNVDPTLLPAALTAASAVTAAAAAPAPEGAVGAFPTKRQRQAQLMGDAWAPKGTAFDARLVVGVALPDVAPERVEPMLLGGRIYKIQTDQGGDSVELAFFNGTRDMQFTLDYTFLEGSVLLPGGPDVVAGEDRLTFSVTVFPGQTKTLTTGRVNGYSMNMRYGYAGAACLDHFKPSLDALLAAASGKVRTLCLGSNPPPATSDAVADLCALGGVPFVDPDFPPSHTSVCRIFEAQAPQRPWLRVERGAVATQTAPVEPTDIDAGLLGDAWLLSALAAVAERPERITAVFDAAYTAASQTTPAQDRRCGIYRQRLCRGGWWRTVVVDDWFPASPLGPAFARSLSSATSLWPSLVEKAFAKMHGSYYALKSAAIADPLHALTDMTGCGCDYFDWRHQPEAIRQLQAAVEGGYLVVVTAQGLDPFSATEAGEQEEALCANYQKVGLVTGYSYAVVGFSAGHCVVRNAWGDAGLWKGDSDPSAGTVSVHPDNLFTLFDSGGVCYVRPQQRSLRVQVAFAPREGPDMIVAVEPAAECTVFATLHQEDASAVADGAAGEAATGADVAAYCTTIVTEVGGEWVQVAASHGGTFWKGRDTVLRFTLKPSHKPYYFIPRSYREDASSTATFSFVFEGPQSDGTVARFLKPTPALLESLCFTPVYNFDPAPCQPLRPLVQMGRGEPVASQSVSVTSRAML